MRLLVCSLLITGCASDVGTRNEVDPTPDDTISPTAVYLSPAQHLTRASMALRGVRPAVEDLERVEADPSLIPVLVDSYLESREFGETIVEMHNETLLMRIEQGQFTFPALAPLTTATARQINSRYDEPLRLIEDIVRTNQPYTNIVTADYTMVNATSAAIFGLAHTGPANEWKRATFSDGRPAAGILSTNALYDRWRSAGANFNRGRANLISRSLLCHDFLHSDIMVDTSVDLSDPDIVSNAVVANSSCAGCHQALDPLASHLFAFKRQITPANVNSYPQTFYQPAAVNQWRTTNKRPPMFYGMETGTLRALGTAITKDPRFAQCTVKRFASYFTEVELDEVSGGWIARLQDQFVESGFNAKALAKAIVLSDEFRISHDTDAIAAERTVGALKVRPDQLHRMVEDITGFSWSTTSTLNMRGMDYGTADLLASDFIGFRVLAGGIDGFFVTTPVHTMNATSSLVAKAIASAAADFVVEHDLAATAAERTLFVEAAVDAAAEADIRAQLVHLHARIYGELVAADSEEIDDTYQLYSDAFAASNNRARAWKLTLVGMLSDFRSLFY